MPSWGRTAPANRRSPMCCRAAKAMRSPKAPSPTRARTCSPWTPIERAAKGVFLAFQYPIEIPGVATMQFLKVALNAQRKARGEKEMSTPDFMRLVKERAAKLEHRPGHAEARRSMSASPAAKRSAPKFCRWRCSSQPCAFSMKPIPASISMRCASSPTA